MCRERCGIDLGYVVVSRTSKALGGALHIAPRNVAVDYRAVKPAERIPMIGDDVDGGCCNTQFFQVVKPPLAGRNKTQACEDRSEVRRVGKACVSKSRSGRWPYNENKKILISQSTSQSQVISLE